jgi:hypothetical protein
LGNIWLEPSRDLSRRARAVDRFKAERHPRDLLSVPAMRTIAAS